jgi:tetratricopeptide (TPR) repeat protein
MKYTEARSLQVAGKNQELLDRLDNKTVNSDPRIGLLLGIALALTGRGQEAQRWLQTKYSPANGPECSDIGLASLLKGDVDTAVAMLEEALRHESDDAVTHGRLAATLLTKADLVGAERHYHEAINRQPGRAEWHSNLGGILARQQRLEEALEQYSMALRADCELVPAKNGRIRMLELLERGDEVTEELQEALKKQPEDVEIRLRLARTLQRANRLAEAAQLVSTVLIPVDTIKSMHSSEKATAKEENTDEKVKLGREQIALRMFLVELLREHNKYPATMRLLDEILLFEPDKPEVFIGMKSGVLTEMKLFEQVEELLDKAELEFPDSHTLRQARAKLLSESGRYAEAEALLRGLVETYPGNIQLKSQLGQTLLWIGQLEEAAELFETVAKVNPLAFAGMVNADCFPDDPAILSLMESIADNPLLDDAPRISMGFAVAQVLERSKEYDLSFRYLSLANGLVDGGVKYRAENFTRQVNAVQKVFSRSFLDGLQAIRASDRTPVFVVGMPRSGTTLTEQILCSHPAIFGAGELDLLARLTRQMPRAIKVQKPYPFCVAEMSLRQREEAAKYYLHGLFSYDRDHPFVVDKMPHNFMHLGLIQMIFPRAKVVHIQRDPRDTAVSNFQQNFAARHGGMGFSFDLVKIARQINDYHRLMAHWRGVLSIDFLDLRYEELVADQEGMTRRLLDFVGVGWDEQVMDFDKTERAVRTASVTQVRQPIYQTSKQKWRRYEQHLGPLLDNLDPATYADYL